MPIDIVCCHDPRSSFYPPLFFLLYFPYHAYPGFARNYTLCSPLRSNGTPALLVVKCFIDYIRQFPHSRYSQLAPTIPRRQPIFIPLYSFGKEYLPHKTVNLTDFRATASQSMTIMNSSGLFNFSLFYISSSLTLLLFFTILQLCHSLTHYSECRFDLKLVSSKQYFQWHLIIFGFLCNLLITMKSIKLKNVL